MSGMTLHFDGLCEPNPGLGSWGFVFFAPGIGESSNAEVIPGQATNNVAEYWACGKGLKFVLDYAGLLPLAGRPLTVFGDSKLVISQVRGEWECNSAALAPLLARVRDRVKELAAINIPVTFQWLPREQNKVADALSVRAWEQHTKRKVPVRPAKP